jgi:NADH dehydrogenase
MKYYPTLYHTATGGKRANSSIKLSDIFAGKNIDIVVGSAKSLDRKTKTVKLTNHQELSYDYLVIGLGVVTNYFGIPGLADYAYSIKGQSEVWKFKRHLHKQIIDESQPDLHYVIVGAGPTGIELAGALPTYLRRILHLHGMQDRGYHVDLIEAQKQLLPMLSKKIARKAARRLKKLKVRTYLGKAVQGQSVDGLTVSGKPIRSHTVVWTAGVTNHPFFKENQFVIMARGKVAVDIYLQTEQNIFVIGDNASTPYSGMAQTALHDGEFVARNLIRKASGKDYRSYKAKKPFSVIPIGKKWAIASYGNRFISGRLGWLVREAADLVGFHDLQPWPKAIKQYMTEFDYQDDCSVCSKNK